MAFATEKIDKWVSQQIDAFQPRSDQYGFGQPSFGVNFQNHPFKFFFISSNAPVVESDSTSLPSTVENDVIMNVAVNKGLVYDLSRYKNSRQEPLYITKRKDGRFLAIGLNSKEFLSEDQLSAFEVPVTINGQEMKEITRTETGPQIPLKLKMRGSTANPIGEPREDACVYLQITFEDTEDLEDGATAGIDSADLLSGLQIKEKYSDISIASEDFIELPGQITTTRFLKIFDANGAAYTCLNSARSLLEGKRANSSSYSPAFAKALADQAGGGLFYYIFQPRESLAPILKNHLFLRIF